MLHSHGRTGHPSRGGEAVGLQDAAPPAQIGATEATSFLQLKAMRQRVQPLADYIQQQATVLHSSLDEAWRLVAGEGVAPSPLANGSLLAKPAEPEALSSSSSRRSPVTISLAASLVPNGDLDLPEYKDHLSTLEWLHDANWELTCCRVVPSFLPLPEGMHVPLETYCAMQDEQLVHPSGSARWELYVDGATSSTSAAWSVIVVKAGEGTTSFHGQLSGLVDLSPSSPSWLGAHCLDNIAAEFVATLVALHAIHSGVFQGGVVLRPDLRLSKLIASQECTTSSNPLLAKLIRLHSWWLGDALQVCEVRGHQRHPWNELADRVAKFALQQQSDSIVDFLSPLRLLAIESQDAEWAWLQSCPHPFLAAFPPLCDGQVMQFPPSLKKAGIPLPAPMCKASSRTATWTLDGRLVTANVLALDTQVSQQEHGRRIGVRTQRLDAQWHQQRIFIVGLQEARTSRGVFHTEHYQIWSSGGAGPAAGRLGCELWCHRTIAIASTDDGRTLTLANFKVVVQHADERRLFVRFENEAWSFAVAVLHAPCLHSGSTGEVSPLLTLKHWWAETAQLCERLLCDDWTWCLIDANAPLASSETASFGLLHAEPSNRQGAIFEDFLLEQQMVVPSTFQKHHLGPSETWTHPTGKRMRRDYILTSSLASFGFYCHCQDMGHDGP